MTEHVVANADDIEEGERIIAQVEGREIGIFRKDGEYHAFLNWCPHQGGPVCEGTVSGTNESTFDRDSLELVVSWSREGAVLNCPWHGWEFDLDSGDCLAPRDDTLPAYPVEERDGDLILEL